MLVVVVAVVVIAVCASLLVLSLFFCAIFAVVVAVCAIFVVVVFFVVVSPTCVAALASLEIDELAVVVPDLDDGHGVVVGSPEVVHLSHYRHQAVGSPSTVDVSGLHIYTL